MTLIVSLRLTLTVSPSDSDSDSAADGDGYDSDASLTMAVNKSFTLSCSLTKRCGLELDEASESDCETQVRTAASAGSMGANRDDRRTFVTRLCPA